LSDNASLATLSRETSQLFADSCTRKDTEKLTDAFFQPFTQNAPFRATISLYQAQHGLSLKTRHKSYKAQDLLYVPPALIFRNCVFCPQCTYMFGVDQRTNSDYFSLQH